MKAISIMQPWASLIMAGEKQFETRSWDTKYRDYILIHASAGRGMGMPAAKHNWFLREVIDNYCPKFPAFNSLPFGAVLGYVKLQLTARTNEVVTDISKKERAFGDFSNGRYAWKMIEPVVFETPIPYKGQQSLWEFPNEVLWKTGIYVPSNVLHQ